MNPNWQRWITASLNKNFNDVLSDADQPLPLYIEGTDRRTNELQTYAELRVDGPYYVELSKGYWQIDVDIDVLIDHKVNNEDLYAMQRAIGTVLAAFTTDIPVFMYGDGTDDDPMTQLGCFKLLPDEEPIRVTNFGQPKLENREYQATVNAKYRMNLST